MDPYYAPDVFNNTEAAYFFAAFAPMVGLLVLLIIVEIVLKGLSLWRAARMEKTTWFVFLLILNTAGILPLIFLLITNHEYDRWQHGPKTHRKKK